MKTPKPSTPAPKNKLNTPRSGFIQKNTNSAKKIKFNVFDTDVTKSSNGTPKLDQISFKEKKMAHFGSGKKSKSPLIKNVSPQAKEDDKKNSSPRKRKSSAEFDVKGSPPGEKASKKEMTPKTGKVQNQHSPNSKFKQNKTSPEVQLGLDIEQYLDKNSSLKKSKHESTPLGRKQQIKSVSSPVSKDTKSSQLVGDKLKTNGSPVDNGSQSTLNSKNVTESEKSDEFVDSVTLTNGVKALIKYIEGKVKGKDELFDSNIPLFLQINYIKQTESSRYRILVPHSLVSENSDICLFIADKGIKKYHEDIVDDVKERLQKCKINYVNEIISWRKALLEHSQYEQQMKLMNRFDFFLIESKLTKMKGKLFSKFTPSKNPISVKLTQESRLKSNIETALRKVAVSFKGNGLTSSVIFGHYKMGVKCLVENIEAILKEVCDETKFLGGGNNVRSIFIKSTKSPAFPLYMTTKSPNLVKTPKKKVVKKDEGVEGELSTYTDRIVKVFKDGTVTTKKIKNEKEKEATSKQQKKAQTKKGEKTKILKKEEEEEDEEEESDDEEDVDEMESSSDLGEEEEEENEDIDVEEDDEEDDDDEEEEEEDEEVSDDEDEDVDNKFLIEGLKKLKQTAKNKKKRDSSTDEEKLEEAEQHFLKELRQQQDKIETEAKAKKLQAKPQQKNLSKGKEKEGQEKPQRKNLHKQQKKEKKRQPNKENFPSGGVTEGKGNIKQQFPQGKKNNQQSNVNTNIDKTNDETIPSKKSRRRRNKNKKGNSNFSPNNKQASEKPVPKEKTF